MSRIYTQNLLNNVEYLIRHHEYLKKNFIRLEGQKTFDDIQKCYDRVRDKLTKELKSLPIGYRYTGTFYLRVPYSSPVEFEKVEGTSLFMREDIISWIVEDKVQRASYYYRNAFKEPST